MVQVRDDHFIQLDVRRIIKVFQLLCVDKLFQCFILEFSENMQRFVELRYSGDFVR